MQISESLLSGEETCTVWSNVGSVVQQGSNFTVYCSFKCTASRYPDNICMYCYDFRTNESTEQLLEKHNSTTVYFKVYNITGSKTYSCNGECHTPVEFCGLDMEVGCKYRIWWTHLFEASQTRINSTDLTSDGLDLKFRGGQTTEEMDESCLWSWELKTSHAVTLQGLRQTFRAIRAASKNRLVQLSLLLSVSHLKWIEEHLAWWSVKAKCHTRKHANTKTNSVVNQISLINQKN